MQGNQLENRQDRCSTMFQLQIFQFSICPLFWAQLCSKDFKIDRWPNMLYLEWQSFQSNWNFGTVRLYIILSFFSSWARRVFPAFNLHSVDLWSNLLVGDMKYGLTKYLPIFFPRCPPIFAKLRRVPSKYWPSKCYKSLAFVDICKIACDQSDGPWRCATLVSIGIRNQRNHLDSQVNLGSYSPPHRNLK